MVPTVRPVFKGPARAHWSLSSFLFRGLCSWRRAWAWPPCLVPVSATMLFFFCSGRPVDRYLGDLGMEYARAW